MLFKRFIRDPLVTFLFLGALLFFVTDWFGDGDGALQIEVTADRRMNRNSTDSLPPTSKKKFTIAKH